MGRADRRAADDDARGGRGLAERCGFGAGDAPDAPRSSHDLPLNGNVSQYLDASRVTLALLGRRIVAPQRSSSIGSPFRSFAAAQIPGPYNTQNHSTTAVSLRFGTVRADQGSVFFFQAFALYHAAYPAAYHVRSLAGQPFPSHGKFTESKIYERYTIRRRVLRAAATELFILPDPRSVPTYSRAICIQPQLTRGFILGDGAEIVEGRGAKRLGARTGWLGWMEDIYCAAGSAVTRFKDLGRARLSGPAHGIKYRETPLILDSTEATKQLCNGGAACSKLPHAGALALRKSTLQVWSPFSTPLLNDHRLATPHPPPLQYQLAAASR
ncbi:hypothetical protein B0H16DRAFT_1684301 [Mycena metata]|uniref:Uncharacterized protein n=1 Tax=Mycena metata TaxID=1033252 RepID=A0AAD7K421_9AGAR|nr:hypothetical protein B0H16DRAFT_1684301 [Mycena metata]